MIKTPLSTVIGGAGIWTPGCTVIGGQQNIDQLIKSLFSDGTQGIYLNAQDAVSVSDLSSIKDLSGRNNHAAQPNATSRATLITDPSGYKSLKFDGVDDGYVTQSIDFSNTDKVTVICAYKFDGTAGTAVPYEFGTSVSNIGTFGAMLTNNNTQSPYKGATTTVWMAGGNTLQAPRSNIQTSLYNLSGTSKIILNGITYALTSASSGGGNFGMYQLYIGRRGGTTLPFNGQIYALLVIGKLLDDATTQRIEKEFAKYIGVTL